jgi:hypothetical protein
MQRTEATKKENQMSADSVPSDIVVKVEDSLRVSSCEEE